MKDEEDIVFFRMGRGAKINKDIFQRILQSTQDKPTDECWAETQSEVKLTRNPVVERLSPPASVTQDNSSNSNSIKISHHETEQSVIWQIEVDKEAAKTLDYVFDGFAAFLTRLLSA